MTTAPQRGRPAERSSAQTQLLLIDSATIVFARRGYAGATVAELVQRAGVTAPVLYHHFGDKAGLYEAAITQAYDVVLAAFAEATACSTSYPEALGALLATAVDLHRRQPALAAFVAIAPLEAALDAELRPVRRQLARTGMFLRDLVTRCGGLPGASAEVSVDVGVVVIGGLNRLAATKPDPRAFARTARALADLLPIGVPL